VLRNKKCKSIGENRKMSSVVKTVSEYVDNVLIPNENKIPTDYLDEFIRMGFFRIGHSEQYGGLGLSLRDQILLQMQFGRTKLGFRNQFSTTTTLASGLLDQFGEAELLEQVNNGTVISMAYTEPEKTSSTTYKRVDDNSWKINGSKLYISNSPLATWFIVFASGTFFLVHKDQVEIGNPHVKMGQEENPVADVYFNNSISTKMLGQEGRALPLAEGAFTRGRLIVTAVSVGMCMRMCDEMVAYAKARNVFQHQLVQGLIADSVAKTYAAKATVIEAATNFSPLSSSAAKLFCTNAACQVADNAVQVLGGYGIMRGHIIEQFYRDVRVMRLYEGTDEIQKLNIAKHFKEGILNE